MDLSKKVFYAPTDDTAHLEQPKDYAIDIVFICINGQPGSTNVDKAVRQTNIIRPKIGIPKHYRMFADNTEGPKKYISRIKNSFEMEFNREYEVEGCLT